MLTINQNGNLGCNVCTNDQLEYRPDPTHSIAADCPECGMVHYNVHTNAVN